MKNNHSKEIARRGSILSDLPFWTRVWLFIRHYLVKLRILKPIDWYYHELPPIGIANLSSVEYPGKPKVVWTKTEKMCKLYLD